MGLELPAIYDQLCGWIYTPAQVLRSLTQNPLHLIASLDFADEAPLERADTRVELKPEEHHRSGGISRWTCIDKYWSSTGFIQYENVA